MAGDAFTAQVFAWLNQVVADRALPPAAFKLAYVISQHINRHSRTAWPSQERLASEIGLPNGQYASRTVRRLSKALVDGGHLLTTRRKQNSLLYRLAQDRTELSYQNERTKTEVGSIPDISDRSTDPGRTFVSAKPDNSPPQDRAELSAKPLKEPLKNHERERRTRAKPLPLDFGLDRETYGWAISKLGDDEAVNASMFRFENHYRSVAGAKGLSADWMAKARLWIDDDVRRAASDKSVVNPAKRLRGNFGTFDSTLAMPVLGALSDEQWEPIIARFAKTGQWTKHVDQCGNAPPAPDCRAPKHLLAKYSLGKDPHDQQARNLCM